MRGIWGSSWYVQFTLSRGKFRLIWGNSLIVEGEWETWVHWNLSALMKDGTKSLHDAQIPWMVLFITLLEFWFVFRSTPEVRLPLLSIPSSLAPLTKWAWVYRYRRSINHHALNLWYLRLDFRSIIRSSHPKTSSIRVRFISPFSVRLSHAWLKPQASHRILFGRSKSLAGTLAAVLTGTLASYVFWTRYSSLGDEHDLSWLPGRALSTWTGKVNVAPWVEYGIGRLPSPESTLGIWKLSVLNGCMAGLAEVRFLWHTSHVLERNWWRLGGRE